MLLVLLLLFISRYFKKNIPKKIQFATLIPIVLIAFLFGISLMVNIYDIAWDVKAVYNSANLLIGNHFSTISADSYLLFATNNLLIVILAAISIMVAEILNIDKIWFLTATNISLIIVSFAISFNLLKKTLNTDKSISVFNFLLFILLSSLFLFSPYLRTFYSDTVGLFAVLVIFFIYSITFKAKKPKKLHYLIAIISGFGYLIKPTVVFLPVAIVLIELIILTKSNNNSLNKLKAIMSKLPILALFFGLIILINTIYFSNFKKPIFSASNSAGPLHFFMMGSHSKCENDYCFYGSWNAQDWAFFFENHNNPEYKKLTVNRIKNNITENGLDGYVDFLIHKNNYNLLDGSFGIYSEGNEYDVDSYFLDNKISGFVQDNFGPKSKISKQIYKTRNIIWYLILILSIFSSVGLNRRTENSVKYILILQAFILFVTSFTLLFEGRSRYIFLSVPEFIILALVGFNNLRTIFNKKNQHRTNRQE